MHHLLNPVHVLMRLRMRTISRDLEFVPTPVDRARQHAAGPDPDRVLVLGGGVAQGYGLLTQRLALPGRLADALAGLTGRGAVVDVLTDPAGNLDRIERLLDPHRIRKYDAVVFASGAGDAALLMRPALWARRLGAVLDTLDEQRGAGTEVVVLSAMPLPTPIELNPVVIGGFERLASAYDLLTAALCRSRRHTTFVISSADRTTRWREAQDYEALAARLARVLAPRLDALAAQPPVGSARSVRAQPDPEAERQRALERSGLHDQSGNERITRLLAGVAQACGTRGAAITLIDDDRQRTIATHGDVHLDLPRSSAACSRTIQQAETLVLADLAGDPLAETGLRFYAGSPIETPDGMRIGALCVLDDRPRADPDFDATVLVEFATLVQNELWATTTA